MLGWMDEEALALTRSSGLVHFFSRSRQKLWQKGETSGNSMHVVEISHDCDDDAVLVRVSARAGVSRRNHVVLHSLVVAKDLQRDQDAPEGSYVVELLRDGPGRVARKVGEEAVELWSPR